MKIRCGCSGGLAPTVFRLALGLALCPAAVPALAAETIVYDLDNGLTPPLQTIWGSADSLAPGGSDDADDPPNKSASLSGNILTFNSGAIAGDVYGALNWDDEDAVAKNQVFIKGGSMDGSVYGGSGFGDVRNNTVTIEGGSVGWSVYGGESFGGSVTGNTVTIKGGTVDGYVYGGSSYMGDVTNNTVTISGGTVRWNVYGGYSGIFGDATENTVTISGGTVSGNIYGGSSYSGKATNNTVTISDAADLGTTTSLYGGYSDGDATDNTVTISGGTVSGNVYGGFSSSGNATNNTVTISDAAGFGPNTSLYGGFSSSGGDAWTGNTLNLKTPITVAGVQNFQFYNFYIPATMRAGETMLTVTGTDPVDISGSTVAVVVNGAASSLNIGDRITLINRASGLTADQGGTRAQGIQGITKVYDFDLSTDESNLYATVAGEQSNEQLKALAEGRAAGLAFMTEGSDLILGPGMYAALLAAQCQQPDWAPFVAVQGGSLRYDSGSHIDVDGLHLLTGLARCVPLRVGSLTAGAFFEAGWGSYTSHNSFANAAPVRGDGDTSYYGGGILGRYQAPVGPGGVYGEASLRLGRADTDFRTNDILLTDRIGYEADFAYYGGHLGIGYLWTINAKASLDFSTKYIWLHQNSDTVTIAGDRVDFDAADSHRWRTGARFAYAVNEIVTPYAGMYYDHEFDGKARATANNDPIEAPELAGGTGVGELGLTIAPAKGRPLSLDVGVQGYVGQRQGVTGTLRLKVEF